jgi:NAD(P)H-hydrate epimerase
MTDHVTGGFDGNVHAVLTTSEIYRADKAAETAGVPSLDLMKNAGREAAQVVERHYGPCPVSILAGPGNNGGDGYVIARYLAHHGWPVTVWRLGNADRLTGDAAVMAGRWTGKTRALSLKALNGAGLVVDALFGAGLTRPLSGVAEKLAHLSGDKTVPVVSIDVPSGLDGTSGEPKGVCFQAERTVSFFRKKPGHLLYPGRALCGAVHIAQIGIPDDVLNEINPALWQNHPDLWLPVWPHLAPDTHKYDRGYLLVLSGPRHQTGAARLAARAGLRAGAGVVALASPLEAADINAGHETAVMVKPFTNALGFERLAGDRRLSALVVGPGAGVTGQTRALARIALMSGHAVVLDADALSVFAGRPDDLFETISADPERPVVLTPHAGEFSRLFGQFDQPQDKSGISRKGAARSNAVIVHKGADTVIAAPDGRCVINANAPPTLATAGAGDVLAGCIGGLLSAGMPGFEAACAAVWLQGEMARGFGPGLTADDLPALLPVALAALVGAGRSAARR